MSLAKLEFISLKSWISSSLLIFSYWLKPWLIFLINMNNSKRIKCYRTNGERLKRYLLNGVHKDIIRCLCRVSKLTFSSSILKPYWNVIYHPNFILLLVSNKYWQTQMLELFPSPTEVETEFAGYQDSFRQFSSAVPACNRFLNLFWKFDTPKT